MAKQKEVEKRRTEILEYLSIQEDRQASFNDLAIYFKLSARAIKLDCIELEKQSLVVRYRGGVKITGVGLECLGNISKLTARPLKRKHLRQLVILRILSNLIGTAKHRAGLTFTEIYNATGLGDWGCGDKVELGFTKDAVKNDLEELSVEGLVGCTGDRYHPGSFLMAPFVLTNRQSQQLQHYLNSLPAVLPMEPNEINSIREKLNASLVVGGDDARYEEQVKLFLREVMHGYLPEESQNVEVAQTLRECVVRRKVVEVIYRGRRARLKPLGVIYHWRRGLWYVIAFGGRAQGKVPLVFRLDRMEKAEQLDRDFAMPGEEEVSQLLSRYWGVSGDKTFQVEVRFRNTSWDTNAVERMICEMNYRKSYYDGCQVKLYPDGSAILRDEITGLSEFKSWLRGYGDVVEVISPLWLQESVKETAGRMLAVYRGEDPYA
ncbi:hypothetical protein Dtox_2986 [Desulfofarcimen acetoxidans DSM 771]|uniref:Uncharacterized protein n=1 Tax=Desulfofarcimen acetoxidans (strain ATCC 49208 / DSM 771 / KCTC 5769 / VKM B-1644 / 5575) TaxID=485916 RepID=C8W3F4_DESAS|nr:WYL domain-containing protein [Desulfofarcimen acetoxidans]ACV63740.1 hypothetical protein Dtox_2986 [Desulfofarcimen acetoxidans DSM 771]